MHANHLSVYLSKPLSIPVAGRQHGNPCRTIATKQLVVGYELGSDDAELEGVIDNRGKVWRSALASVTSVAPKLVVSTSHLEASAGIVRRLARLPEPDRHASCSEYDIHFLPADDAITEPSAWTDGRRTVAAVFAPTAALVVPRGTPPKPPFPIVGVFWKNGQVARCDSFISAFGKGFGVLMTVPMPTMMAICMAERFDATWGPAWRVERKPSHIDMMIAERMTATGGNRCRHVSWSLARLKRLVGAVKNPLTLVDRREPYDKADFVAGVFINGRAETRTNITPDLVGLNRYFEEAQIALA